MADSLYRAPAPTARTLAARCLALHAARRVCCSVFLTSALLLSSLPALAEDPPRFVRAWGEEGDGADQFGRTRGIAIDARGIVYITDDTKHRVQTFDRAGNLLGGWGRFGAGPGEFDSPRGIAVDDAGFVFVVDSGNSRIQKFTVDGDFVLEWGSFGTAPGSFTTAWYVAVDSVSNVFVTDGSRVQKFRSDGTFVRAWGGLGFGNGQFVQAIGIAVGPDQTVYVANAGSAQDRFANIQRFTNAGDFVSRWGTFGEFQSQFMTPIGVTTDSQGNVYVVDHHNFRIQKFRADGTFVSLWGQRIRDLFVAPHDLTVDANDDLFIIDLTNSIGVIHQYSYSTAVRQQSWSGFKNRLRSRPPASRER